MTAAWRLISVEVLPEARLRVRFIDGTIGEVHMQAFLRAPGTAGTVFEPLRDPGFLAQAAVVSDSVQWPNGADLAPDAMYDRSRTRDLVAGVTQHSIGSKGAGGGASGMPPPPSFRRTR